MNHGLWHKAVVWVFAVHRFTYEFIVYSFSLCLQQAAKDKESPPNLYDLELELSNSAWSQRVAASVLALNGAKKERKEGCPGFTVCGNGAWFLVHSVCVQFGWFVYEIRTLKKGKWMQMVISVFKKSDNQWKLIGSRARCFCSNSPESDDLETLLYYQALEDFGSPLVLGLCKDHRMRGWPIQSDQELQPFLDPKGDLVREEKNNSSHSAGNHSADVEPVLSLSQDAKGKKSTIQQESLTPSC